MDSTSDLKVRSFRADDETFEKFKGLATEEFGNQGQCLAALINLYETERSKLVLGERKVEVETFQTHLNRLAELFLASMQLNQDAEARVRGEFERLLISKDKTISDLQTKVAEQTAAVKHSEEDAKQARSEYYDLYDKNAQLEKQVAKQEKEYAATLSDKDSLNRVLTSNSEEHKAEIESLKATLAIAQVRLQAASQTEDALAAALAEKAMLAADLDRLRTQSELDLERAVINAEKLHQQELRKAYAQHHGELKEYLTRIEKLQTQHDSQARRIFELEHSQGEQKPEKV
jgi:chromosome segregation ATPase